MAASAAAAASALAYVPTAASSGKGTKDSKAIPAFAPGTKAKLRAVGGLGRPLAATKGTLKPKFFVPSKAEVPPVPDVSPGTASRSTASKAGKGARGKGGRRAASSADAAFRIYGAAALRVESPASRRGKHSGRTASGRNKRGTKHARRNGGTGDGSEAETDDSLDGEDHHGILYSGTDAEALDVDDYAPDSQAATSPAGGVAAGNGGADAAGKSDDAGAATVPVAQGPHASAAEASRPRVHAVVDTPQQLQHPSPAAAGAARARERQEPLFRKRPAKQAQAANSRKRGKVV